MTRDKLRDELVSSRASEALAVLDQLELLKANDTDFQTTIESLRELARWADYSANNLEDTFTKEDLNA